MVTEHGRGKGGGHQKVEQVGYTGSRSGGCTVGLGLGHGTTFQTVLMLVTEKHVI